MISSVNTSTSSYSALRGLNSADSAVHASQKRIASGRKVADAYDDGAAFSVAEGLRGDAAVLGAANERLAVGKGMIDVAVKAGQFISSSLQDVKATLIKLSDPSLNANDRANYQAQYKTQVGDIGAFVKDAKYNGVNLLDQGASDQKIVSNGSGGSVTVKAQDLQTSLVDALTNADVSSASSAAALIQPGGTLATAQDGLGTALNSLAASAKSVDNSIKSNNSIVDATTTGIGEITDADLTKEAAALQAAQVKQQLAGQALSISNQSSKSLLSLFQ
jgi:flagellin